MRDLSWRWLGRVSHHEALAQQHAHREAILGGDASAEIVLLAEHSPTITLGRSANREHVLLDEATLQQRGVTVVATDRGGDVTYHGPGQVMIYPVVRLRSSVVAYLEAVARAIVSVANDHGVVGAAFTCRPAGVWLDGAKLAACGVHLSRGVTGYGYAFNIATPAEMWTMIKPCGLEAPCVSLADACLARNLAPPPAVSLLAPIIGDRVVSQLLALR